MWARISPGYYKHTRSKWALHRVYCPGEGHMWLALRPNGRALQRQSTMLLARAAADALMEENL